MHKRGGGIRTSDLRFMRRGLQPIELLLGDKQWFHDAFQGFLYLQGRGR